MRKKRLIWLVTLISVLVIVFFLAIFMLVSAKKQIDLYKAQANDIQLTLENNTKLLYVAMDDLPKGTVLVLNENVELQENITGLPDEMYITENDMGKAIVVDINAYEPIMACMITEDETDKDIREIEIGVAELMLNQNANDYVDIRIQFPSGEDYIVVAKAKIKSFNYENSLFYSNLSEDEILTLSSAIIDAYTVTGTRIYLAKYTEPFMQEEAIPNYPVNLNVFELLNSDPNILKKAEHTLNQQARLNLQQRLSSLSQTHSDSVASGNIEAQSSHSAALAILQAQQQADQSNGGITYE